MSKNRPTWIFEDEAAKMLGYSKKYFRHQVRDGKLQVAFTNIKGRRFQYNQTDIEKVLLQNSTFIK